MNRPRFARILGITCFSLAAALCQSASGAAIIINDGGAGYSQTGSWTAEGRADGEGGDWRYQNSGTGSDTATYDFSGLPDGNYVAARSTWAQGNLSVAATYTLSDGGGAYTQDQRVKVNHFDRDSDTVTFQRLSGFNGYTPVRVTDGTLSVTVADDGAAGFLIADGVRIESVRSDVQKIWVIGDGDVGYAETGGTWNTYAGDAGDHAANIRYSSGTTADQITVSFAGLDVGAYRISSAWTGGGGGNRSSDVTLSYVTTGATDSISFSQEPGAAADDVFENVNWQDMFTDVTVTDGTLTLTLQNNSSGGSELLIGDGFRMELIPEPSTGMLIALMGGLGLARRRRG